MMITISTYDDSGKITGVISGDQIVVQGIKDNPEFPHLNFISEGIPVPPPTAINWVDGDWLGKPYYVSGGVITPQPENPAVLSGMELSNLPVPCEIKINGQTYQCADSTATLSFNQPGTYKVIVQAWPHLDKEFSIDYPA